MTGVGTDQTRDFAEFVDVTRKRLVALERRQTGAGGGGGGTTSLAEGPGIDITGTGTSVNPYVISADAPALPDPQVGGASTAGTVTAAAAVWADVTGTSILTITPPRDLWVRVDFTGVAYATTGYVALGVAVSINGGAYSSPPTDPMTGDNNAFGQSPFSVVRENAAGLTAVKMMKLLAGNVYAFKLQNMRSVATGSQATNYCIFRLVPMFWANTPVPVRVTSGALTRRVHAVAQAVVTAGITVLYGTAVADSGHFTYNAGTGAFTCVIPGTYRVTANTGFSTATASFALVSIRVNGTNVSSVIVQRTTALQVGSAITGTAVLAVGDVVDVGISTNVSNGNTDPTLARSFIELVPVTQDAASTPAADVDTGWTTLPLNTGWTPVSGGMRARRIGNIVNIQGRATSPSVGANSTVNVLPGTVPALFVPTLGVPVGFSAMWDNGEYNWGVVNAAGTLQVRKTTAGIGDVFINVTYFV